MFCIRASLHALKTSNCRCLDAAQMSALALACALADGAANATSRQKAVSNGMSGLSTLPYKTYCLRGFVTGQRRLGVITVLGVEVAEVHRDA
jgi:hypothetical protein